MAESGRKTKSAVRLHGVSKLYQIFFGKRSVSSLLVRHVQLVYDPFNKNNQLAEFMKNTRQHGVL